MQSNLVDIMQAFEIGDCSHEGVWDFNVGMQQGCELQGRGPRVLNRQMHGQCLHPEMSLF